MRLLARFYETAAHGAALFVEFVLMWILWGFMTMFQFLIHRMIIPALSYLLRQEIFNVIAAGLIVWWMIAISEQKKESLANQQNFASHGEIYCLTEVISRETYPKDALAAKVAVGEVVRLRAQDGVRVGFPDSICGVVWQMGQFTGMFKNRWTIPSSLWEENEKIARDILLKKHTTTFVDEKSCVRFYKRTDNRATDAAGRKFFEKLRPVAAFGAHTFYCEPEKKQAKS